MSFDLKIENYTKDELMQMFDLVFGYDKVAVEQQEGKLKDSIMSNNEISKDVKIKTIGFLQKAKHILLNDESKKSGSNEEFRDKVSDFFNSSYALKPTKLADESDHDVQIRPDRPYTSSYPSEFFTGIINPLKKKTIRKQLNIDTRFRDNYYSNPATNFNVTLPTSFNNVLSMQLTAVEIPATAFTVSKQYGNNFFSITITTVSGTISGVVEIPSGNYREAAIQIPLITSSAGITEAINAAIARLATTTSTPDFNDIRFSVNANAGNGTNQCIFDISGSNVTSFQINFQTDVLGNEDRNTPLPMKLGWLLGFRNGVYENSVTYVSEGCLDMNGSKYIYLVIDDHNNSVNHSFYSAFNSSVLQKNILARISQQSTTLNFLSENNLGLVTLPREYFGPVNIQNLNIQLIDEYGRTVDLNNMDYSFCLTLTTAYDL